MSISKGNIQYIFFARGMLVSTESVLVCSQVGQGEGAADSEEMGRECYWCRKVGEGGGGGRAGGRRGQVVTCWQAEEREQSRSWP